MRLNCPKPPQPAAEEAKFVRKGKAELQICLTEKSTATIEQLKKLGLEVIVAPPASKVITGRLLGEKLAALVELAVLKYLAPQSS